MDFLSLCSSSSPMLFWQEEPFFQLLPAREGLNSLRTHQRAEPSWKSCPKTELLLLWSRDTPSKVSFLGKLGETGWVYPDTTNPWEFPRDQPSGIPIPKDLRRQVRGHREFNGTWHWKLYNIYREPHAVSVYTLRHSQSSQPDTAQAVTIPGCGVTAPKSCISGYGSPVLDCRIPNPRFQDLTPTSWISGVRDCRIPNPGFQDATPTSWISGVRDCRIPNPGFQDATPTSWIAGDRDSRIPLPNPGFQVTGTAGFHSQSWISGDRDCRIPNSGFQVSGTAGSHSQSWTSGDRDSKIPNPRFQGQQDPQSQISGTAGSPILDFRDSRIPNPGFQGHPVVLRAVTLCFPLGSAAPFPSRIIPGIFPGIFGALEDGSAATLSVSNHSSSSSPHTPTLPLLYLSTTCKNPLVASKSCFPLGSVSFPKRRQKHGIYLRSLLSPSTHCSPNPFTTCLPPSYTLE
ncbi:PREDICTED: uncharacterized protein LOC106628600 isoform X2 [Pseudopodoces humilis]|uniref:uncharacterized protein LOC106628600 isoform X2 n=1 Tax=Pseudopodoces humilis TaxID=181119 RepID=UPI0006B85D00|nr:PREDICTED: uncharacterized protein LOC106628600 isoform X2 [Pseudopodoces humilis]